MLIDDKEVTEQKKHPDDDLSFVSSNDQFFDKSDQFISNGEQLNKNWINLTLIASEYFVFNFFFF